MVTALVFSATTSAALAPPPLLVMTGAELVPVFFTATAMAAQRWLPLLWSSVCDIVTEAAPSSRLAEPHSSALPSPWLCSQVLF